MRLHIVDWDVPPDSMFYPKHDWCGHQDRFSSPWEDFSCPLAGFDPLARARAGCL